MFRLIEPPSGQFTNHIEGTFGRYAHCGIPNVYKSYDSGRYKDCLVVSIILYYIILYYIILYYIILYYIILYYIINLSQYGVIKLL